MYQEKPCLVTEAGFFNYCYNLILLLQEFQSPFELAVFVLYNEEIIP